MSGSNLFTLARKRKETDDLTFSIFFKHFKINQRKKNNEVIGTHKIIREIIAIMM